MAEIRPDIEVGKPDTSLSVSGTQRIENLRNTGLYDHVLSRVDQARELQDRANRINLGPEDKTRLGEFVQRMHQLEGEKAAGQPMSGNNQVELDYYHQKFAPEIAEARSDRDGTEEGLRRLQELRSKPGFNREASDKIEEEILEKKYGAELTRRDKEQKKTNAADRKLSRNAAAASRRLETAAEAARVMTQTAREEKPTAPAVEPSYYDEDLAAVQAYHDATNPLRLRANGSGNPLSVDEQARLARLEKSYRTAKIRAAKKDSAPAPIPSTTEAAPATAPTSESTVTPAKIDEMLSAPAAAVEAAADGAEPTTVEAAPVAPEALPSYSEIMAMSDEDLTAFLAADRPEEQMDAILAGFTEDQMQQFKNRAEGLIPQAGPNESAPAEPPPTAEAEAETPPGPAPGFTTAELGVGTSSTSGDATEPTAPLTSEPASLSDRLNANLNRVARAINNVVAEAPQRLEAARNWARNLRDRLVSNFDRYKNHPGEILKDGKNALEFGVKAWWNGIKPIDFFSPDPDKKYLAQYKWRNVLAYLGGAAAGATVDIIAILPGLGGLRPATRIGLASGLAFVMGWSETREKRQIEKSNLDEEEKIDRFLELEERHKKTSTFVTNLAHGMAAGMIMGSVVQAFGIDKASQDFVDKLLKPTPEEAPGPVGVMEKAHESIVHPTSPKAVAKFEAPEPPVAHDVSVPDAGVTETASQALGDTILEGKGMLSIDINKVFPDFHGGWEAAPGGAGTDHADLVKKVMDVLYHQTHAGAIQPNTFISPDSFTADQLNIINQVTSVSSYQDYLDDVGGVRTLVNSIIPPTPTP